ELRKDLAAKVFAHTAAYDAAIHGYLTKDAVGWPERITLALDRLQELRYGENPHQAAALYATSEPGVRDLQQLHGKELSFNNLLDLDAAVAAVAPWAGSDAVACAIIKHTTPCGIALGRSPREAYERALATDRTSAFGSVIAFNVALDRGAAEAMRDLFVEVVVAPAFADDALSVLREKEILLARDQAAIGIGAGQMSRVDASFLAIHKARQQGHDPAGAVLASDAFFPFADGVEEAARAGVAAIIQPGGSVKDAEVVAAADH